MEIILAASGAAKLLGVSTQTLRDWDENGKLPCVRTSGGHRRYRYQDLENFMEKSNTWEPKFLLSWKNHNILPECIHIMGHISFDGSHEGELLTEGQEPNFGGYIVGGEFVKCPLDRQLPATYCLCIDTNDKSDHDIYYDHSFKHCIKPTYVSEDKNSASLSFLDFDRRFLNVYDFDRNRTTSEKIEFSQTPSANYTSEDVWTKIPKILFGMECVRKDDKLEFKYCVYKRTNLY